MKRMIQPYDKSKMTCLFTERDWEVWERIQKRNAKGRPNLEAMRTSYIRNEQYLDLVVYNETMMPYDKKKSNKLGVDWWKCAFCTRHSSLPYRIARHVIKDHWESIKDECEYNTSLME